MVRCAGANVGGKMRHIAGRLIIALGVQLVALGKWLVSDDKPGPGQRRHRTQPGHKAIDLPRHNYRVLNAPPGRWEVIRAGLVILFSSWRFALVGV